MQTLHCRASLKTERSRIQLRLEGGNSVEVGGVAGSTVLAKESSGVSQSERGDECIVVSADETKPTSSPQQGPSLLLSFLDACIQARKDATLIWSNLLSGADFRQGGEEEEEGEEEDEEGSEGEGGGGRGENRQNTSEPLDPDRAAAIALARGVLEYLEGHEAVVESLAGW